MASLPDFLPFEKFSRRIAFVEQSLYRSRRFSYKEIQSGALQIANSLEALSIQSGDRVIIWGQNSARWAMTFYACLLKNVVVVPIDAGFSRDFVDKIQQATDAKLICADCEAQAWEKLFDAVPISFSPKVPEENSLLEIIYTSGTTGDPKGVMITHENILANLIPIYREYQKYKLYARLISPIGFAHLIPLSHLFGQIMGLFIPQMLGGKAVFTDPLPSLVITASRRNKASALICVPKELSVLRKYVEGRYKLIPPLYEGGGKGVVEKLDSLQPSPLPSLNKGGESAATSLLARWWRFRKLHRDFGWKLWGFITGGASLPVEEEDFWSALGFAVVQGYGLTETAPSVTISHPFKGLKRGSVGKKLPGVEIKIASDGEILVRGPNVSPGYYRNPKATDQSFADGWLHTGDLGSFDEEGNLKILGRKKEVIVTAEGLNIYPNDVEDVLNSDVRVRESAVIAQDSNGAVVVHAVLVLQEGVNHDRASDIIAKANEKLEAFQRIQSCSIWPEKELPRTTTGKLKRLAIATGAAGPAPPEMVTNRLLNELLRGDAIQNRRLNDDLGLTSLDRLELMVGLENATGTNLDEARFAKAKTLEEIQQLLQVSGERPRRHYPHWHWSDWILVRWFRTLIWYLLVFPLMPIRIKMKVSGRENLAGLEPPVLFISNHQSILDVPVILKALPFSIRHRLATAMGTGRAKLDQILAALFFNTYPLPGTSIGLREALQHAGDLVDRGYSILVFPEGERTETGNLIPFRQGIGVIAKQLKIPVVPVLLRGVFEIWPPFANGPRVKGTAQVHFGWTFVFTTEDPAEITKKLEAWYMENY